MQCIIFKKNDAHVQMWQRNCTLWSREPYHPQFKLSISQCCCRCRCRCDCCRQHHRCCCHCRLHCRSCHCCHRNCNHRHHHHHRRQRLILFFVEKVLIDVDVAIFKQGWRRLSFASQLQLPTWLRVHSSSVFFFLLFLPTSPPYLLLLRYPDFFYVLSTVLCHCDSRLVCGQLKGKTSRRW